MKEKNDTQNQTGEIVIYQSEEGKCATTRRNGMAAY